MSPRNLIGRLAVGDRALHPGAWWLWALGLAAAASRTLNPLLLLMIVAVAAYVVAACRTDAPWSRSFGFFLRLGIVVILLRMLFQVAFGGPSSGRVLIDLPAIPLPDWAAGVGLGGPVTSNELVDAFYQGLQLATILACVGAANSLANTTRLLKSVPGALYEVGVAVVVALTFAPQLVTHVSRVRQARRLRGRPYKGFKGLRGAAMPVLEGALERSLDLAAAMDSRGYGRTALVSGLRRLIAGAATLGGLLGVCVGVYGLLDASTPPLLGLPLLLVGVSAAAVGLVMGGQRSPRTTYRPDLWRLSEWLVAASGLAAVVAMSVASSVSPSALTPSTSPLEWPSLPWLPTLGLAAALLPALVAPAKALEDEALPFEHVLAESVSPGRAA